MRRLNQHQLEHLAKILSELANLTLVGLTLNQILATAVSPLELYLWHSDRLSPAHPHAILFTISVTYD